MTTSSTRAGSRPLIAVTSIVVFLFASSLHEMLGSSVWLTNVIQVAICFAAIAIYYRAGLRATAAEFGLHRSAVHGIGFAFIAASPMLVLYALGAGFNVNPELALLTVVHGALIAPFAEELLFRAYLFRQLYRRARWNFWVAALTNALVFGLGHIALNFSSLSWNDAGVFVVTGIGAVFFGWLYVRWDDNFWVPFGIHMFMNLWWDVFAVADSALGGILANSARLLTLGLAIGLTLYRQRIFKTW